MYTKKTIALLFLLVSILFTQSCSKRKPEAPEDKNGPGKEDPVVETSLLLPLKISYGGITYQFSYQKNTTRFSEIKLSSGERWVFTNLPEKKLFYIRMYHENDFYAEIDYRLDDFNNGIRSNTFTGKENALIFSDYSSFKYNSLNQLARISTFNVGGVLISEKTLAYTVNPNTTKIVTGIDGESYSERVLRFDQKNGIFKHVANVELIATHLVQLFFQCRTNNVLTLSDLDQATTNISYEYNTENYPEKAIITKGRATEKMTITYVSVKKQ